MVRSTWNGEEVGSTLIDLAKDYDTRKLGLGVVWDSRVKEKDTYIGSAVVALLK